MITTMKFYSWNDRIHELTIKLLLYGWGLIIFGYLLLLLGM